MRETTPHDQLYLFEDRGSEPDSHGVVWMSPHTLHSYIPASPIRSVISSFGAKSSPYSTIIHQKLRREKRDLVRELEEAEDGGEVLTYLDQV